MVLFRPPGCGWVYALFNSGNFSTMMFLSIASQGLSFCLSETPMVLCFLLNLSQMSIVVCLFLGFFPSSVLFIFRCFFLTYVFIEMLCRSSSSLLLSSATGTLQMRPLVHFYFSDQIYSSIILFEENLSLKCKLGQRPCMSLLGKGIGPGKRTPASKVTPWPHYHCWPTTTCCLTAILLLPLWPNCRAFLPCLVLPLLHYIGANVCIL